MTEVRTAEAPFGSNWPSTMTNFLSLPYHQPAFLQLTKIFADEIRYVLTRKYAEFRGDQILARFPPNQVIESAVAWKLAREVLDSIENALFFLFFGTPPFFPISLSLGFTSCSRLCCELWVYQLFREAGLIGQRGESYIAPRSIGFMPFPF